MARMAPEARGGGSGVSVVVRIRPPLPREAAHGHCTRVQGDRVHLTTSAPEGLRGGAAQERRARAVECAYDRALDMSASQEDVWNAVCPMVEKALEGYNATVLTYGMTGSGKTYTMLGPTLMGSALEGAPVPDARELQQCDQRGLVPRVLHHVFQQLRGGGLRDACPAVALSYMQIYQERCYDLLRPPSRAGPLRVREAGGAQAAGVLVEGLKEERVDTAEACLERLAYGFANIAFRATNYNEQSSRSHSVLTLTIRRAGQKTGTSVQSKIRLVDLAGNERWDTFGSDITKLHSRELASINRSLHVLGLCVQALSQAPAVSKRDGHHVAPHVPYRDSALTMVLRDSLSGNSFTTLLCTLCGSSLYQVQSLCTLRFADRAKRIKMHAKIAEEADCQGQRESELAYLRSLVASSALRGATVEQQKQLEQQISELEQMNDTLMGENRTLKKQLETMRATASAAWAIHGDASGAPRGGRDAGGAAAQGASGSQQLAALLATSAPLTARAGRGRRAPLRRSSSEPAVPTFDPWLEGAGEDDRGLLPDEELPLRSEARPTPREAAAPRARPPPAPTPQRGALAQAPAEAAVASTAAPPREPREPQEIVAHEARRGAREVGGCCPSGHRLVPLGSSVRPIATSAYSVWHCDMAPLCSNGSQDTPELGRFHCARCSHDLCEKCYVASLSQESGTAPAVREAVPRPRHCAREESSASCAHREAAHRPRPPSPSAYARPSRPGGLSKGRPARRRPAAPRAADPPAAQQPGGAPPAAGGGARAPAAAPAPRQSSLAALPHASLLQKQADRSLQARLLQGYQRKLGAQVSTCSTAAPTSLVTTERSSFLQEGEDVLRLPQLPSPRASQAAAAAPDACDTASSQRWWRCGPEQPRTPRLAELTPRLEDPGRAWPRRPSLGAERAGGAAAVAPPASPRGAPLPAGAAAGSLEARPSARAPALSAPPPASASRKEARAADAPPPPPPMLGVRRSVPGDEDRGMRAMLHELDLRRQFDAA